MSVKKLLFFLNCLLLTISAASQIEFQRTYGSGFSYIFNSIRQTDEHGYIAVTTVGSIFVMKTDSNGDTLWIKTYDDGQGEFGNSIEKVNQEGYIIVGSLYLYDAYLLRIDEDGSVLWAKRYSDSTASEEGFSVKKTFDNGFILAGSIYPPGLSYKDVYVVKTNESGDVVWSKTYGEPGNVDDYCYSIHQTSDSGYIILAHSSGFMIQKLLLIKTDSSGDTLWTRNISGPPFSGLDEVRSLIVLSDGSYVIVGTNNNVYRTIYVTKISSTGNVLWYRNYNVPNLCGGGDIKQTFDGGFIVCGYVETNQPDDENVYLLKTDSTGFPVWSKAYIRNGDQMGLSLLQSPDSGFIIAALDSASPIYLIKTDQYGNSGCNELNLTPTLITAPTSVVNALIEVADINTVATPSPAVAYNGDSIGILCSSVGIANYPYSITDFACYFSSWNHSVFISFYDNENENAQVELLDITGRVLLHQSYGTNNGFNKEEINAGNLSTGIYIVSLLTSGGVVSKKLIIE
jgi:hypothetical protein